MTADVSDAAGNAADQVTSSTFSVDTTIPTITSVTSTSSDGTYSEGDAVSIMIVFSEAVTVSGTPQLTLETGGTDSTVDYTSGSGSNVLIFTYTVSSGDTSTDLDYVATNSLALNGGTIADSAGNSATLTLASPGSSGSLGSSKNIVIDATTPTVSSCCDER